MNQRNFPDHPVLLVDDEEHALRSLKIALSTDGINNVICCQDSREVKPILSSQNIELMLLDISMPYVSGEELLSTAAMDFPDVPVIIITGHNDVELAIKCIRTGAADYLVKPIEREQLLACVHRTFKLRDLQRENRMLRRHVLSDELEYPEAFTEILTVNKTMKSIFQYMEAIAGSNQPVLITGETGVGKELVARALHTLSKRKGLFVSVNVAGLDDNVFADTLFGHRKGAFTGADQTRNGLVEQASAGTLFLDEIGDLSTISQVNLLRLLQEHEYFPLGSDVAKRSDARILVATNRDIASLQQMEDFRNDLYYRLRTHHINLPPLRERKEDIALLASHFLNEAARVLGKKQPTPPKELFTLLATYRFPGNIRELKSMVFDAVSKHKSKKISMEVFKSHINQELLSTVPIKGTAGSGSSFVSFSDTLPTLKQGTQLMITEALRRAEGNQTIAAQLLGISQQALSKRLQRSPELLDEFKK